MAHEHRFGNGHKWMFEKFYRMESDEKLTLEIQDVRTLVSEWNQINERFDALAKAVNKPGSVRIEG